MGLYIAAPFVFTDMYIFPYKRRSHFLQTKAVLNSLRSLSADVFRDFSVETYTYINYMRAAIYSLTVLIERKVESDYSKLVIGLKKLYYDLINVSGF